MKGVNGLRRKDREVKDFSEIIRIIESCDCCRLGFVDNREAYIVPLNFGYEIKGSDLTLYFHSAKEGRKIDLVSKQEIVSFELDCRHKLVTGKEASDYSFLYQCVMGKGTLEIVDCEEEKKHGLSIIMDHYSNKKDWCFDHRIMERVSVLKLSVKELSAKAHCHNG